jgi:methanogenic corrinoid protein MtbC1
MRNRNMSTKNNPSRLISAIAHLKEDAALNIVRGCLASGNDPVALIAECQEGLRRVGERYEKQKYYLSGLVMGGEIFTEVTALIQESLQNQNLGETTGKVLIGTVAGDIHDLGKNIFKMLLKCYNFSVFDLGVDTSPAEFLKQAKEIQPDIIGLSGLITSTYNSMRETVQVLHEGGCFTPIIIGGSLLNESVFKYTGADYWVTDANTGVQICQKLLSVPPV